MSEDDRFPTPFVFPSSPEMYPTSLFPNFDMGDYTTIRNVRNGIYAKKGYFTPSLFKYSSDETYDLGIIASKRESEEYEDEDGRKKVRKWLGKSHILSDEDTQKLLSHLQEYDEAFSKDDEEMPESVFVDELFKEFYLTPFIKKLPLEEEEDLLKNSCWMPQDLSPTLGQKNAISPHGMKYERSQTEFAWKAWGYWLNNPKKRIKKNIPPMMELSTPLTPANIWLDLDCEGEWVSVDEASNWGALGQRQHPKNLKKEEHYEAWNEWTNNFLLNECMTPEGRIYLYAASAKGWDKRTKSWKQTYYGQSYTIDLSRLRPMAELHQLIEAKQAKYGKKTSYLEILPMFRYTKEEERLKEEAKNRNDDDDDDDDDDDWGFPSWGEKIEDDDDMVEEKPKFNPFEHMFLPIIWVRAQVHGKNADEFGYHINTSYYHPSDTKRGVTTVLDKMTEPHQRERFKVWKPKKTLPYDTYVAEVNPTSKNYTPIINHKSFFV